jgi:hypothetical protein
MMVRQCAGGLQRLSTELLILTRRRQKKWKKLLPLDTTQIETRVQNFPNNGCALRATQEVGRLFCGKCGNAALQKVEVVVGPEGAEQFGVRKKHLIRGTRFSLPKPKARALGPAGQLGSLGMQSKVLAGQLPIGHAEHSVLLGTWRLGVQNTVHSPAASRLRQPARQIWCVQGGKNSRDPILREDVLLQRVPQLRHTKKAESADAFAPEFTDETWYQKSASLPPHVKAAAAALGTWKRNPNERRHVRTNRRRK